MQEKVNQTLAAIEQAFKAAAPRVPKRYFGTDWRDHLVEIERLADSCFDAIVGTVPADQVDELAARIRDRRKSLPLSSGTTDQFLGISKQILAFGAAGLAAALAFSDKAVVASTAVRRALTLFGILYVELVLISLAVLILYMLQARFRYPFLYFEKIGNAWPFFYYASIDDRVPRAVMPSQRDRLSAAKLYADDLVRFGARVVAETPVDRLRAELQQYFLLMSYQGYAHQFALRLGRMFIYGFTGSAGSTAILAVYWLLIRA